MRRWQRCHADGREEGDERLAETMKHKLSQIYWLNKEQKMWQRELDRINNQSLVKGKEFSKAIPHGSSTEGKPEQVSVTKEDLKRLIDEQAQKIEAEKQQMMQYILTLEDSQLRQIIHYRCVCLLPWNVVATEIGGGNTADSVRKRFERFLEEK